MALLQAPKQSSWRRCCPKGVGWLGGLYPLRALYCAYGGHSSGVLVWHVRPALVHLANLNHNRVFLEAFRWETKSMKFRSKSDYSGAKNNKNATSLTAVISLGVAITGTGGLLHAFSSWFLYNRKALWNSETGPCNTQHQISYSSSTCLCLYP